MLGCASELSPCTKLSEWQPSAGAGEDQLGEALKGAHVVIIPAGVPRKPGMTRDDLFKINAGIVRSLVEACGKHCPEVGWVPGIEAVYANAVVRNS